MVHIPRAFAIDSKAATSIAELEKEGNKVVQIKLYAEVYTMTYIIVK